MTKHITTTLFLKPMATNSLLQYNSFHPQHLRNDIPVCQFLRIRRNCSDTQEFRKHAGDFTQRFQHRGCPKWVLSQAIQRAATMDREFLLQAQQRQDTRDLRFVTTYNNQWSGVRGLLHKHWYILGSDIWVKSLIPPAPLLTARRAMNLKDRLTHIHFTLPHIQLGHGSKLVGSYPCRECSIRPHLHPTKCFLNPGDGNTYLLKQYINC